MNKKWIVSLIGYLVGGLFVVLTVLLLIAARGCQPVTPLGEEDKKVRDQTFVSREQAEIIVISGILNNQTEGIKIYIRSTPLRDAVIKSWTKEILSPYEESWFFFIDDHPLANWGHPCRYVFVDAETGAYEIIQESTPPNEDIASTLELITFPNDTHE